jgi:hypothetical protein
MIPPHRILERQLNHSGGLLDLAALAQCDSWHHGVRA